MTGVQTCALPISIVGAHGGVILRFIGDAIMAVFGVPVASTTEEQIRQNAVNAVTCALTMQRKLIEHNHSLKERGLPMIGMRIGILTGPMVAGSMGSAERLEYNVHGDTVNTAARIEGFDKTGFVPDHLKSPCRILIGQRTYDLIGDGFITEPVGEAQLKGKEQVIRIYRVLGRRDEGPGAGRDGQPGAAPAGKTARVAGGTPH